MKAEAQIEKLANFIMAEIDGEPSEDEGAVDCAIRIMKCQNKDKLTGSEAVYGLLGWLTSREGPVTFSGEHDAAIAAELADQFCKTNNLAEPRENWGKNLIHPSAVKVIEIDMSESDDKISETIEDAFQGAEGGK